MAIIQPGMPQTIAAQPKVAPTPADAGEAAPYHDPLADKFGKQAETIPCPFWKLALNEGLVHPDADGNVSIKDMRAALTDVGAKDGVREAAILGVKSVLGPMLGASGVLATIGLDHINVFGLRQSPLMHTGDSGILRDGFNQARLDRLLNFSTDGTNVSLSDLAAANADQVAKNPGEHGHTLGMAEYTLLVTAFGHTSADGDKYLSKQDLTTIYKDAKFPADWEKRNWGVFRAADNIFEFAQDQKHLAGSQPASTTGDSAAGGDVKKSSGVCPFLSGQTFSMEEAAKQHADKLPPQ
jgi:hypothetical protein